MCDTITYMVLTSNQKLYRVDFMWNIASYNAPNIETLKPAGKNQTPSPKKAIRYKKYKFGCMWSLCFF